jgi:alkylhydroperoxidase/carboxymuconolactone decarboxylase family protein YurZ
MTVASAEETFRRLTIGEPGLLAAIADPADPSGDLVRLDDRTEALLRIAALIALDAPPSSYRTAVDGALRAGTGLEDLLAVLLAVAGPVGSARIISAAPRIALAAGYDVEAALEANELPARTVGPAQMMAAARHQA